jgi:hypothetical protein
VHISFVQTPAKSAWKERQNGLLSKKFLQGTLGSVLIRQLEVRRLLAYFD